MISFQKLKCQSKFKFIIACFVLLAILFVVVIIAKNKSQNKKGHTENSTGAEEGEIEQPQIMIDGKIFYYFATGFDKKLPENSKFVGEVEKADNTKVPQNNFEGVQVREGQKIYRISDNDSDIYVEYDEDEYAVFSIKQ